MGRTRKQQLPVEERAALPFAVRIGHLIDTVDNGNASELAKVLQCSPQAISQFRNGNAYPKTDNLIKIAKYYHVSTDYLLGLTDDAMEKPCAADEIGLSQDSIDLLAYGKGIWYQDLLLEAKISAIRSFIDSVIDALKVEPMAQRYILNYIDTRSLVERYTESNKAEDIAAIRKLTGEAEAKGIKLLSPFDAALFYVSSAFDLLKERLIITCREQWGELNNGKTE